MVFNVLKSVQEKKMIHHMVELKKKKKGEA
jgi:hypothetical protein